MSIIDPYLGKRACAVLAPDAAEGAATADAGATAEPGAAAPSTALALSDPERAAWQLADGDEPALSMRALEPAPAGGSEWDHVARGPSAPVELPAALLLPAPPASPGQPPGWALHTLRMSDRAIITPLLPPAMWALVSLVALDLSRNRLAELPPAVGGLVSLQRLDVSRNRLKELPKELGSLKALITLEAQSNHLRPAKRSLPLAELGSLPALRSIDLRFNQKLKAAGPLLAEAIPQAKALLAGPPPKSAAASGDGAPARKEVAADRDATLLRSQLEPLSTPMLRRRLANAFGTPTDPEETTREQLMGLLLECYAAAGSAARIVKPLAGRPLTQPLVQALLAELRGTDWASTLRERTSVNAQGYITLQRPPPAGEATVSNTPQSPSEHDFQGCL